MAYIPDPTDATQPEDEVDASTAAAEFRALKTYILGLVAPSAILKNPKRQTVVSASVNASGQPNFLSVGTGLNFNIDGSSVPVVMTFADGYDVNGAVDNNSRIVSNLTNQGTLSANLVNYLAATFVDSSSVTYSAHLLPPQYGPVFDRNRNVLLQFENNILDDYGNTWTAPAGNSFVSGGSQKFGTYALNLNGTSQYLRNTDFTALPQGSWEIKGWYNFTGLPGSGAVQTLLDVTNTAGLGVRLDIVNTAGVTKLRLYASSNGTSNDIANAVLGANTTWATGTWYEYRIIFDALTNNYRVYLSIAGAAETQDISVASSARICPLNRVTIGATNAANQNFNGSVDCFHISACARAAAVVVPATTADEIDGHWFDSTAYKMYEITGASTAAGDNPEMTAVNRLFFGEANASTITVASITAYAINGKYDSGYFEVTGVSTSYSKAHNIGTSAIKADVNFSQYSDGSGWRIFAQRGNIFSTSGTYQGTPIVRADTKNVTLRSGSTNILGAFLDENGTVVTPTTAYARVVVERNF